MDEEDLNPMADRHLRQFLDTLKAYNEDRLRNKIEDYEPYPKQMQFHKYGINKNERLLSAGNQLGKTYAGAMEAAYHATGIYPSWWEGRRWGRPTKGWVGGESAPVVRDTSQKLLLGDLTISQDMLGTGAIPADKIVNITYARGVALGVDTVTVKHISGGLSVIKFKSYEQQRVKWQGDTIDWVWFDEEPPEDIYAEGLARFTATQGMSWMTFTPLKGMSKVVKRFKNEDDPKRAEVIMTAHDAKHITPEMLEDMMSKYPVHQRSCRINGVPMQGEGAIFNIAEEVITCDPFNIPEYWPRIVGFDAGYGEHPSAAVWIAIDRDTDIFYAYKEYRMVGGNVATHAAALRSGGRIPIAWPPDLKQKDRGIEGKAIKRHYEEQHCLMLPSASRYPDERGNSVWAGITDMQERFEQGRFRVFKQLTGFLEEFRNYHMEDGIIVKLDDDLLDAARYAIMMRNHARMIDKAWFPGQRRTQGVSVAPGTDFNVFG